MSRKTNPAVAAEKARRAFSRNMYLAEAAFMRDCFGRDDAPYPSDVLYYWRYALIGEDGQPLPPDPLYWTRPDYMRPEVAGVLLEGCLTWKDAEARRISRASYFFADLCSE